MEGRGFSYLINISSLTLAPSLSNAILTLPPAAAGRDLLPALLHFGDDTADLDAASVAVLIAIPVNVDENQEIQPLGEEEEDKIKVCVDVDGRETREVTLEELQDLIDEETKLTFVECEA